jgi:hypothetical protein
MSTQHLTFSTRGRMPVAPSSSHRRALVRALLRVAGTRVALFAVVDDHVHVVVMGSDLGRVARVLCFALRACSPAELDAAYTRPVRTRAHAEWLLGYLLGQWSRHDLSAHPALTSGSCFAELSGSRAVPGWTWNLSELLPRLKLRQAYTHVGLDSELREATPSEVQAAGATRLAAAAAFAAAAAWPLLGNSYEVAMARRAVAAVGASVEIAASELARALEVEVRQVARLAGRQLPPGLARATLRRLHLENVLRAAMPSVREVAGQGAASGLRAPR